MINRCFLLSSAGCRADVLHLPIVFKYVLAHFVYSSPLRYCVIVLPCYTENPMQSVCQWMGYLRFFFFMMCASPLLAVMPLLWYDGLIAGQQKAPAAAAPCVRRKRLRMIYSSGTPATCLRTPHERCRGAVINHIVICDTEMEMITPKPPRGYLRWLHPSPTDPKEKVVFISARDCTSTLRSCPVLLRCYGRAEESYDGRYNFALFLFCTW